MVRNHLIALARKCKNALLSESSIPQIPSLPFDNAYPWLAASSQKLWYDKSCPRRPQYIWGVLQGAALGRVLGMKRISVIEFGVAGGAGLLALEAIAERCERLVDIQIDVYGFDTGSGLPKPEDYRDLPNLFSEGQFVLNFDDLKKRLRRAQLKLGLVKDTVPDFMQSSPAPVAFVAFDLDLYTSTVDAFRLFSAHHSVLLPRVLSYLDDIVGFTYCEYNGERLAISEFNQLNKTKKICPIHGLKYYVPPEFKDWYAFDECMYFAHLFDHPLYNVCDVLHATSVIDVSGNIR